MKVCVKTPARLHLGLIDLNGDLGRLYGGLGVAIDNPNVVLEAEKSSDLNTSGQKTELTRKLANQFLEAYGIREKVAINVEKVIPAHVGLGSGTQLALAVASSISKLFDIEGSPQDFAAALGRTAQSGVGTAAFAQGGLVIDAGKNTRDPSKKMIPPICRMAFPDEWRFVVAIPNTKKGLANKAETSAFEKLPPMSSTEVGKICRLTMLKLLPSIPERDIASFGSALTEIQRIVGDAFAEAQGGRYASTPAGQCIDLILKEGAYGAGQSSWGPTVYGVVKAEEANGVYAKVQAFLNESIGGQVFIAKGNNHGSIQRKIEGIKNCR
jgi:beta-ribofuranosylaminobenzene 5'-phosphate synthase